VSNTELSEDVLSRQGAWHQSTLDLVGNCSWRYFLTYQLGLPDPSGTAAIIGTSVHAAVEAHESARIRGDVMTLEAMQELVRGDLSEKDAEVAAMAVASWFKSKMKDKGPSHRDWLANWQPVAVEQYFNLPLVEGCWPIGGTMDGLYMDDDGIYHVVDLKTAKDFSRWKADGAGKRHQATMYSVAVQLMHNLNYLPDVAYTVVRTKKGAETARRVFIQPDLEDVRILGQKIRDAQRIIEEEDYVKNPSWALCSKTWCPHYAGCMETGELSGRPVTVRARLQRVDL